ncbi:MAG TPA: hypothetical protein VH183_15685 [Burkholderiaceae bacterium]|jgi:hypothetical protein|nr:hypothetical protein [Burkholderiaceae bacterium]
MESGVLGLGAVSWSDAWNAAAPEPGLRLSVDPARLLELLRGMPVARALLSDLQRASSAGRSVGLFVSPDHQVAEIATGSGHYVLTVAARNSVLAALVGRSQTDAMPNRIAPVSARDQAGADPAVPQRAHAAPGILWEAPTAAARERAPSETIALPWLGPAAHLEVRRDGARGGSSGEPESGVVCATLHLQLPDLGHFDAHIRVCGSAVAVWIDCAGAADVEQQLAALQRRLSARGLVSAHVGIAPARSP